MKLLLILFHQLQKYQRNKNKKVKILFDDIDMMKSVEEKIFEYFTVVKFIKPNCRYKNLYVELIIEKKQLQKFKNYVSRYNSKIFGRRLSRI